MTFGVHNTAGHLYFFFKLHFMLNRIRESNVHYFIYSISFCFKFKDFTHFHYKKIIGFKNTKDFTDTDDR